MAIAEFFDLVDTQLCAQRLCVTLFRCRYSDCRCCSLAKPSRAATFRLYSSWRFDFAAGRHKVLVEA